jgi:hypothetical protein
LIAAPGVKAEPKGILAFSACFDSLPITRCLGDEQQGYRRFGTGL